MTSQSFFGSSMESKNIKYKHINWDKSNITSRETNTWGGYL